MHDFPLRCFSRQTGYIALDMEFTKPQIKSEHFKRCNSDYIPRVRQQYEINVKPCHVRDILSQRFLLVLYWAIPFFIRTPPIEGLIFLGGRGGFKGLLFSGGREENLVRSCHLFMSTPSINYLTFAHGRSIGCLSG